MTFLHSGHRQTQVNASLMMGWLMEALTLSISKGAPGYLAWDPGVTLAPAGIQALPDGL